MNTPYATWTEEQKQKARERTKRYKEKHPEMVRADYDKRNARRRMLYATDETYRNSILNDPQRKILGRQQGIKFRLAVKKEIFDQYGNVCKCCEEARSEFLTIDHVDNNGAEHRKEIGSGSHALYLWLRRNNFPTNFRTLCINCNFALGHSGYCPHEREREANGLPLRLSH